MFQELKKLWNDTTKNPKTGKYSQKRPMSWGAFFFAMFMSSADVVEMNIWPEQAFSVTKPNVEILWVWATIAIGGIGITAWSKIKNIRSQLTENDKEE